MSLFLHVITSISEFLLLLYQSLNQWASLNPMTPTKINTKENIQMRLLTNDNSTESVKRLSRTACVEFGYIRSIYEKLTPIADIANGLNFYEQQIYVNEGKFKGVSCNESVETFKECQLVEKSQESNSLYEIEIECLCKFTNYLNNS